MHIPRFILCFMYTEHLTPKASGPPPSLSLVNRKSLAHHPWVSARTSASVSGSRDWGWMGGSSTSIPCSYATLSPTRPSVHHPRSREPTPLLSTSQQARTGPWSWVRGSTAFCTDLFLPRPMQARGAPWSAGSGAFSSGASAPSGRVGSPFCGPLLWPLRFSLPPPFTQGRTPTRVQARRYRASAQKVEWRLHRLRKLPFAPTCLPPDDDPPSDPWLALTPVNCNCTSARPVSESPTPRARGSAVAG
ncbi:hypothetical protein ANO11243_026800 [Dothideomycetidae sp. 11243]|nr:hypothetical protein ANO11243_026800 [fungal sp. No.11243]